MKMFKLLKTELDYIDALSRVINLQHFKSGSDEHEELELLRALIKDYESQRILPNTEWPE